MKIKAACGVPEIRVADVEFNKAAIMTLIEEAAVQGVDALCLPELCLTGATCGDLFLQDTLIRGAEKALSEILSKTKGFSMPFTLGLPVKTDGRLYNCAALCRGGAVLGYTRKTGLSHAEKRWFSEGGGESGVFDLGGLKLGIMPGGLAKHIPAGAAAQVVLSPFAEIETVGAAARRREWISALSEKTGAMFLCAGAGEGESTTDAVYAGHCLIAAKGAILAESRFKTGLLISDLDRGEPRGENPGECAPSPEKEEAAPLPFVPRDRGDCEDVLRLAAYGLKKRMEYTGLRKLVLGVSGGLDSTLAMLICARTLDMLKLPRENLIAVTMPGFGTTGRTRSNAEELSARLRASFREISIEIAVRRHFLDIGHDESNRSAVFENAQARERTQILMDIANGCGGIAVGTGDMSELALGWATYNGDHMAMYGVNAGIPKTLARAVAAHVADTDETLTRVLRDVLETPVSPELLPQESGQKTENIIGPYELHDFFLFHLIGEKRGPREVMQMAERVFKGAYSGAEILKWEKVFIERFFSQQFKRSCMPDGVQVVGFSLSPRGGLVMPSDAVAALWLKELE